MLVQRQVLGIRLLLPAEHKILVFNIQASALERYHDLVDAVGIALMATFNWANPRSVDPTLISQVLRGPWDALSVVDDLSAVRFYIAFPHYTNQTRTRPSVQPD